MRELGGANMDIDLSSPAGAINWKQDACPWNQADETNTHRCAVKNTSICKYFRGMKPWDKVLCAYPNEPNES